MEIKQVSNLVNLATQEALGETELTVAEDLSNVVDIGTALFDANSIDAYVKSLINHIGRVIVVNRSYQGKLPKLLREGWEFGSVLEKVSIGMPASGDNESWELVDGAVYENSQFYKPTVTAKFFNKMETYEVDMSITELQVKQSFSNASELNAFVSAIFTAINNSMEVKIEQLERRIVNNMIGETIHNEYGSALLSSKSTVKAVNLLYEYNNEVNTGNSLTVDNCMHNADFIRYAVYRIGLTIDRLGELSTLFNIDGQPRFTPAERLNGIVLSEFVRDAEVYLYNAQNQMKDDYIRLADLDKIAFWQGSGTSFDFDDTSKINIKTTSGDTITTKGILACVYDRDAMMVCNKEQRVKSFYVPKAEFTNYFYKYDVAQYADTSENFVVFFIA